MPVRPSSLLLIAPAFAALALHGAAQERDRAQVPEEYAWNLAEIYPSIAAWREATGAIEAQLPDLDRFRGQLGASATALADALDRFYGLHKELSRTYAYASMLADQDTRDTTHEGMRQEMVRIAAAFSAAAAFIEPEILALPDGTVTGFLTSEPRLAPYQFYLEDVVRRAPHTLSPTEEKLLAGVGPLAGAPGAIYNILTNADFPYPTVTLSDGTEVRINQANYGALRASRNRADREVVMSSFFASLGSFGRTLGSTMNASVQRAMFQARARKYESTLDSSLNGPNIPVAVYTRLVDGVNRHLPSFHRYLNLRKRMLGVDELHYYDLYAPLVDSVDLAYTPREAEALVREAMAPLGELN